MYTVIFDCQGFHTVNNQFIPKEVAFRMLSGVPGTLVASGGFMLECTTPSYEIDVTRAKWLMENHHQHNIDAPGVSLELAQSGLRAIIPMDSFVFVKGREKVRWVKELLPGYHVYNIEENGCPSLPSLRWSNGVGRYDPVTAQLNVYLLHKWWNNVSS